MGLAWDDFTERVGVMPPANEVQRMLAPSGGDDTAAIAARLAVGGDVVLADGDFTVSSTLTFSVNGTRLSGSRNGTTITKTGAADLFTNSAGIRGMGIEHLTLVGGTGSGDLVGLTANFGHVQLIDLLLQPSSVSRGIDARAGNGIDIYMRDVRITGGTTCFDFDASLAVEPINTVTAVNCYAQTASLYGWNFANIAEATLIGCAADSNLAGYILGGSVVLEGCTSEGNTAKGFTVQGSGQITFVNCIAESQLVPFEIIADANVTMIGIRDSSTPSGNGLQLSAAATGKNILIAHGLVAPISVNASAKLTRFDAEFLGLGGGTVDLYKGGTGILKTSATVHVDGDAIIQQDSTTGRVQIGEQGPGGQAGFRLGLTNITWITGSGTPEGAIAAPIGSLYTRTNGGANTTLYVKESGASNTGWVPK